MAGPLTERLMKCDPAQTLCCDTPMYWKRCREGIGALPILQMLFATQDMRYAVADADARGNSRSCIRATLGWSR